MIEAEPVARIARPALPTASGRTLVAAGCRGHAGLQVEEAEAAQRAELPTSPKASWDGGTLAWGSRALSRAQALGFPTSKWGFKSMSQTQEIPERSLLCAQRPLWAPASLGLPAGPEHTRWFQHPECSSILARSPPSRPAVVGTAAGHSALSGSGAVTGLSVPFFQN